MPASWKAPEAARMAPGLPNSHDRERCSGGTEARRLKTYPHPYPSGWYRLADSAAIGRGEVRELECFGREFILRREQTSSDIEISSAAGSHPADEVHGQILVYFRDEKAIQDADAEPPYPAARIAEVDAGQFVHRGSYDAGRVHMHIVEFAENGADYAHFQPIHGRMRIPWTQIPVPGVRINHSASWKLDPERKWVSYFLNATQLEIFGKPIEGAGGSAQVMFYGPASMNYFRFRIPKIGEIEMIQSHLPVRPLEQQVDFRWFADRKIPRLLVSYVVGNWISQWRRDIGIWENKIYREVPALAANDGPVYRMRRWYRQFLPESDVRIPP
ncbi:MAG: hypothetical protein F4234_10905 [Gammaproteobacteria bacterium]|nr:hypothetical protein [Gammaproteobacteria bacterium]